MMQYRAADLSPPMVAVNAGDFMLQTLYECGPVKGGVMGGHVALEWVDLQAYNALTSAIDEPWEARLLIQMSEAYARGLHEGESPRSIAPIDRE